MKKGSVNLFEKITKLKKERNAIILAHYYQEDEIQDIADFIGDSLALSKQASDTQADIIVFAGVHFMAETAKILNPDKKVLIPDPEAGCSLADSCQPEAFSKFLEAHPNHEVITYINCTAEIKALSDIICTSSNALQVINSVPEEKPIIFAPDKNMGRYLQKLSGRKMLLWDGSCIVHHEFSVSQIQKLKERYPGAKVIAHPECNSYLLEIADFIGSTSALLKFTEKDDADVYIIATETGLLHQMKIANPNKNYITAPAVSTCAACQQCPYMKMNTLEKLYLCLKYETPEIAVPKKIREKAFNAVNRMMKLPLN